MQRSQEVLTYWFGTATAVRDGKIPEDRFSFWFDGDEETDKEIRNRFGDDLVRASKGLYDDWQHSPQGRLALILLFDQFSRSIYRGTPEAFAYDERALTYALDGIDGDHDCGVSPMARAFYYLPLEHTEELGHQQRCVELFRELVDEAPQDQRPLFEDFVTYAEQHRDTIERFGRFPHRNAILGRQSTPEEQAYLDGGGATYGQSVT